MKKKLMVVFIGLILIVVGFLGYKFNEARHSLSGKAEVVQVLKKGQDDVYIVKVDDSSATYSYTNRFNLGITYFNIGKTTAQLPMVIYGSVENTNEDSYVEDGVLYLNKDDVKED